MICMVSRHYPAYKIEDVFRLTPKQAFLMLKSFGKERMEYIKMVGQILGVKEDDSDSNMKMIDEKITASDYAKMMELSSGKKKIITESFGKRK